jgi:hypothetical protein
MPLPTRHEGESEDKFISRCMSSEAAQREFPGQKQRLGFCYTQFRRGGGKAAKPKGK